MKKLRTFSLLAILTLVVPAITNAQAFPEGTHAISGGIGAVTLIGTISKTFDTYGDLDYSALGPLYFKYEYAVSDNIGLGLNFAYFENRWGYSVSEFTPDGSDVQHRIQQTRGAYSILARVNFHMGDSDKFDPYVGLGLGYRDANWTTTTTAPSDLAQISFPTLVQLGMEFTIGARYFFTDNLGLYAEVGAAKSIFQGGIAARF